MRTMPSISVLIPAHNEAATLGDIVDRTIRVLRQSHNDFEIVVLNDGSTDSTTEILQELCKKYPKDIRILQHRKRLGIARTLEELYREGQKEILLVIHGDGQYPPENIPEILQKMQSCDIVLLARTEKHYSLFRHILSGCYRWLPRMLFGVDLYDSGCSKCMRREVVWQIPVTSRGIFVEAERVIRASRKGYRITKADITPEPRRAGRARGGSPLLIPRVLLDMASLFFRLGILRRG